MGGAIFFRFCFEEVFEISVSWFVFAKHFGEFALSFCFECEGKVTGVSVDTKSGDRLFEFRNQNFFDDPVIVFIEGFEEFFFVVTGFFEEVGEVEVLECGEEFCGFGGVHFWGALKFIVD